MAKKLRRRPARSESGQASCMWGFISIFDFRGGPTNQKMLPDKRGASRHTVGSGLPKNKLDTLTNPKEKDGFTLFGEESTAATAFSSKPTVKKLMEDEMFSCQDVTEEIHSGDKEPKLFNTKNVHSQRKSGKRTNRDRSKSCEILLDDQHGAKILQTEWPRPKNLQKRSTRSLDMDEIMEFYQQIQQQGIDYVQDQHNENGVHNLSNQKYPDFEKKLSEAIKIFLSQKIIDRNCMKEDEDHQPSNEHKDARQILNCDKKLAPKHLQGSKSVRVKFIEHVWNADQKNDNDSKLIAQEQPEKGVHRRRRKFFGRKVRSSEKSTSTPNFASQPSSRIVILKPRPRASQHPRAEDRLDSSPKSQFTIRNKGQPKKVGSYIFLTELKRKLKSAMGKDRREVSADKNLNKCNEHQVLRDKVYKDNVGMKSPSKDHFFIERITRPSKAVKKGKMAKLLQECETTMEYETGKYPKQQLSDLYMEAKKHLSDMLSYEHEVVDFSGEKSSKKLGSILSLPESNSPPTGSPVRDCGQVTGGLKLCASDKSQNQDTVDHLHQSTLITKTQMCISDDRSNSDTQDHCDTYSKDSNTQDHCDTYLKESNDQHIHDLENGCCSVGDKISKGGAEILQATEILAYVENSTTDTISDPSNTSILRDDQDGVSSEACEKSAYEEIQLPPSPSKSTSSITENIEDLEDNSRLPERPSPVSVLEPPFTDEYISPASVGRQPDALLMQPLRIQVEDYKPSPVEQDSRLMSSEEDKQLMYEFTEAVLLASGLRWDDFYIRAHSSDQLLDPSIFDEVEFFFGQLSCDKRLIFDCINEVFLDVYWKRSSSFTGLSIIKPAILAIPDSKSVICEVWEGVQWHLLPPTLPNTLDQTVKKDMSKSRMWMDIQYDAEVVILGISEAIFEDLMEEITLVLVNGG